MRNKFIPKKKGKSINSGLPNMYFGKRVIDIPLYIVWNSMRQRCYNPKCKNYHRWGGRGIKVCKEWKESFISFYEWAISNGYENGRSLDRINNDGNYTPKNCHFANAKQQARNRFGSKYVEWEGKKIPLTELCENLNLVYHIIKGRLDKGWNINKAISVPNLKNNYTCRKKRPKKDMLVYAQDTGEIYTDKSGKSHKIYQGRTGRLFFKQISKSGRIYKYLLTDDGKPANHYIRKNNNNL